MVTRKLYCFVDESGQDTEGRMFVVSVVVAGSKRDELLSLCEKLEEVSGKRKDKWGKAKHQRRMRYISDILTNNHFKGCLRYCRFHNTRDYDKSTVEAIVSAVRWKKPSGKYTTLVYIDGLRKTKRHEYGTRLRHLGLPVRRVRGVARDETNALTRLADAIAGFVRDALDGKSGEIKTLFQKAKRKGMIIEVSP